MYVKNIKCLVVRYKVCSFAISLYDLKTFQQIKHYGNKRH